MLSLFPTEQADADIAAAQRPARAVTTTAAEAFATAWETNKRYGSLDALGTNSFDAYQSALDDSANQTGEVLNNPYAAGQSDVRSAIVSRNQQLAAQKGKDLPDESAIYDRAVTMGRAALARQSDVAGGAQSFGTGLARAGAGFATQISGPSAIVTNALALATLPEGGGALRAALTAGGVFGAQTAAEEALTFPFKQQVDPQHGIGDVLTSIGESALGGAILEGGTRGLGALWRRRFANRPDAIATLDPAVRDAAVTAERSTDIAANSPFAHDAAGASAWSDTVVAAEKGIQTDGPIAIPQAAVDEARARTGTVYTPREPDVLDTLDAHVWSTNPSLADSIGRTETDIAQARAAMDDLAGRTRSDSPFGGTVDRIADLQADLDRVTGPDRFALQERAAGQRPVRPSARQLRQQADDIRSEIARLQGQHEAALTDLAGRDQARAQLLRERLNDATMARAALGPQLRAAREASAKTLGIDLPRGDPTLDSAPSHSGRAFEQPPGAEASPAPAEPAPAAKGKARRTKAAQAAQGSAQAVSATPAPVTYDRAGLLARFADKDGAINLGKTGAAISAEARQALADGRRVTMWNEGKPTEITFVTRGMMTDAKGQRWGVQPFLQPRPGDHDRIEIGGAPSAPVAPPEPRQIERAREMAADGQASRFYGAGQSIKVRYQLAELGSLIASHDAEGRINPAFPAALQPRDRAGRVSREQVQAIANNLEPERLGPSPEANAGSPIVGPDGIVESGNGRVAALAQVYDRGADGPYKAFLERSGFDTEGFDRPVLVGRRVTALSDEERAAFAHASNASGSLRMSAVELSLSDARHITPATADLLRPGEIGSRDNRPFVQAFLDRIPPGERGAFWTRDGSLSSDGVKRLNAALTARAYDAPDVVARLFEHPDPNVRTLGAAMVAAAPDWIRYKDAITRGELGEAQDITADVVTAMRAVMRARDERVPLATILHQSDMFASDISAMAARLFFTPSLERPLSKAAMIEHLESFARRMVDERGTGENLFGEPPPSTGDVLQGVVRASDRRLAAVREAMPRQTVDAVSPEVHAAAEAGLIRDIEQGRNRVPTMDADGNVSLGFADAEIAAIDRELTLGREIATCNTPMAEAAE